MVQQKEALHSCHLIKEDLQTCLWNLPGFLLLYVHPRGGELLTDCNFRSYGSISQSWLEGKDLAEGKQAGWI